MPDERLLGFAQKIIIVGIIFCILALIFIPLLPWVGVTSKDTDIDSGDEKDVTNYASEADIIIAAEGGSSGSGGGGGGSRSCPDCGLEGTRIGSSGGEAECPNCGADNWYACQDCYTLWCGQCGEEYDIYGRGSSEPVVSGEEYANIREYTSEEYSNDMEEATQNLSDNISYTTIFFWLALLFLILGIIGVTFAFINNRNAETSGKILILIGAFAFIFAILAVIFSGLCFMNVMDMQKATDDFYDENDMDDPPKIFFGYNYLPLIFGILLLIVTLIFFAKVFPKVIRSFRRYPPGYYPQAGGPPRDYGAPPPRYDAGPPPPPPGPPQYDAGPPPPPRYGGPPPY